MRPYRNLHSSAGTSNVRPEAREIVSANASGHDRLQSRRVANSQGTKCAHCYRMPFRRQPARTRSDTPTMVYGPPFQDGLTQQPVAITILNVLYPTTPTILTTRKTTTDYPSTFISHDSHPSSGSSIPLILLQGVGFWEHHCFIFFFFLHWILQNSQDAAGVSGA